LRDNQTPIRFLVAKDGLILGQGAEKNHYLNELDVKKQLLVFTLQRSEGLRLYNSG
jgi:hypothetical protein